MLLITTVHGPSGATTRTCLQRRSNNNNSKMVEVFLKALNGSLNWTWKMITFDVPWYTNYFYGLIAISLVIWMLELAFPWRKDQGAFRKDFWLDGFYMFFNFFVFSIAIAGVYAALGELFELGGVTMSSIALLDMSGWPGWVQLLVFLNL